MAYPRFGLDYGLGAANTANCYYEGWIGIKDKKKYFDYSLMAAEKIMHPHNLMLQLCIRKAR